MDDATAAGKYTICFVVGKKYKCRKCGKPCGSIYCTTCWREYHRYVVRMRIRVAQCVSAYSGVLDTGLTHYSVPFGGEL